MTALLFDFDGTIADTSLTWTQTTLACFAAAGRELDELTLERLLAGPWGEVLPEFSPGELVRIEYEIVGSIREAYLACEPAAGLGALLERFAHVPKAIVTSSYRERLVEPYLRRHGLAGHFPVIVGSEDTTALKPDPEPVLRALRLLGAGTGGAWMIGDEAVDLAAARSAGIGSISFGRCAVRGDHSADSMQALAAVLDAILA